jgi:hypothetical protein
MQCEDDKISFRAIKWTGLQSDQMTDFGVRSSESSSYVNKADLILELLNNASSRAQVM